MVTAARLHGVSIVDQPAYPESVIQEVREEQQQPKRRRRLWL